MKTTIREKRVLKYGSPYYNYSCATIAASAYLAIMVTDFSLEAQKYLPMDNLEITNISPVNIDICLDDGDTFIVPHGTIKTITDKPFRRLRVHNRDAVSATGADLVLLQIQKLPITTDTYIRRFKL